MKRDKELLKLFHTMIWIIAPATFVAYMYFFVFFFTIPMTYSALYTDFFMGTMGYSKALSFFCSLLAGTLIISFLAGVLGIVDWADSQTKRRPGGDELSWEVFQLGGFETVVLMGVCALLF